MSLFSDLDRPIILLLAFCFAKISMNALPIPPEEPIIYIFLFVIKNSVI